MSHVKAPQKRPTTLDSREPAYLRLLHDHQDRNAHGEVDNPTAAYDPALVAVLRDLFPHRGRPRRRGGRRAGLVTAAVSGGRGP